jgi:hypothetical protein
MRSVQHPSAANSIVIPVFPAILASIATIVNTLATVLKMLATLLPLAAFSDPALINSAAVAALVEARAVPAIDVEAYGYLFDRVDIFECHGDIG